MRSLIPAAFVLAACLAGPCLAAGYPEKTVRFVVPFPPGGGTDALARLIATKLGEYISTQRRNALESEWCFTRILPFDTCHGS